MIAGGYVGFILNGTGRAVDAGRAAFVATLWSFGLALLVSDVGGKRLGVLCVLGLYAVLALIAGIGALGVLRRSGAAKALV